WSVRLYINTWLYCFPSLPVYTTRSSTVLLSFSNDIFPTLVDPSANNQCSFPSLSIPKLTPGFPVSGSIFPFCGPLHELFTVCPSPSTITKSRLSIAGLSSFTVNTSDCIFGPPPKSDRNWSSSHVLGTGSLVFAASIAGQAIAPHTIPTARTLHPVLIFPVIVITLSSDSPQAYSRSPSIIALQK